MPLEEQVEELRREALDSLTLMSLSSTSQRPSSRQPSTGVEPSADSASQAARKGHMLMSSECPRADSCRSISRLMVVAVH